MISNGVKAFCSWSGGKESMLSLYKVQKEGIEVKYLLNMLREDGKYSRSHGLSSKILQMQAENIGIPIIQSKCSWETYEDIFKNAVSQLKEDGVTAGIFGDIDVEEHRSWVERVCKEIGLEPILPLWGSERGDLLREFIGSGFKAIVVVVDASFMGKEWLGRDINNKFVNDLRAMGNIDLCGEKGEYHTFVYDGPIFKKPAEIIHMGEEFKDNHWFLKIEER